MESSFSADRFPASSSAASSSWIFFSDSASQKIVPLAESSMIRPLGAVEVVGVGIVSGRSVVVGGGTSGLGWYSRSATASPSIGDSILAYPKYSPDLLAEKIKYTFSAA